MHSPKSRKLSNLGAESGPRGRAGLHRLVNHDQVFNGIAWGLNQVNKLFGCGGDLGFGGLDHDGNDHGLLRIGFQLLRQYERIGILGQNNIELPGLQLLLQCDGIIDGLDLVACLFQGGLKFGVAQTRLAVLRSGID